MKASNVVWLALIGLVPACSDASDPAAPVDQAEVAAARDQPAQAANAAPAPPPLLVDGQGLRVIDPSVGATPLREFGMSRKEIEGLAIGQLGMDPERSGNRECGAGPMQFSTFGNLTLNFQEDRFVGWFLRGEERGIASIEGIEIGSSEADIAAAGEWTREADSTLGDEFTTELGLSGFLGDDGRVENLYAGTNCFFR